VNVNSATLSFLWKQANEQCGQAMVHYPPDSVLAAFSDLVLANAKDQLS